MKGRKPQRLKPGTFGTTDGTAEAVPLQDGGFLQRGCEREFLQPAVKAK
jgi:hypothetical protein